MYHQQPILHVSSLFQPYMLEVTGEGELAVPPNLAFVNLGVINEGKDLTEAQRKNAAAVNRVIQTLLNHGILKEHIQTFDYRIDSQYDFEQGKQIFRGYKVSHLLRVKIEDLSSIGNIVDSTVLQGANYVADVQFSVIHKEWFYLQSLSAAIADAQQKANSIASSIKVTLQPAPVYLIERSKTDRPLNLQPFPVVKGISTAAFEPGQLLISAKITAYFRYQA